MSTEELPEITGVGEDVGAWHVFYIDEGVECYWVLAEVEHLMDELAAWLKFKEEWEEPRFADYRSEQLGIAKEDPEWVASRKKRCGL